MASSKEYLQFILGQLSELEEINYRAMMGEFILYYRGKIVGGIYDDRLLIKPVSSAISYMPTISYELPYEGAKEDVYKRQIQQEWDAKKEQKAGFVKDSEAIHGQLERISNQDTDAKEQLIQVQSQIAEETMEIEQSKEEIMRLLNNRASTQAKIQHFDTTQQQITTRRAQIHRDCL